MRLVEVAGIELEVHDVGMGDPVVLVQTALTADELAPLAEQLVARGAYRAIVYHRRGYANSSPVQGPGSVVRDTADPASTATALSVDRPDQGSDEEAEAVRLLAGSTDVVLGAGAGLEQYRRQRGRSSRVSWRLRRSRCSRQVVLVVAEVCAGLGPEPLQVGTAATGCVARTPPGCLTRIV